MAHAHKASGDSNPSVPFVGPWNEDVRSPSLLCLLRTKRDLADLEAKPIPGVSVSPVDDDVTKIHVLMIGPADTPYEGGFFHFFIECGADYPMQPPSVRLLTTDAGRVQFSQHIYCNGNIFLDPYWTPTQSIGSLLASILSLLQADAYSQGHLPAETYQQAMSRHISYVQHETLRVAVCDTVEACLQGNSRYPPDMAERVIPHTFLGYYNRYREIIEANLHLSGREMRTFAGSHKGIFQYNVLLVRLDDLLQRLKNKYGTSSSASA
ncbi:hypothetical protein HPB50_014671 [Hyalomma asiaticum]|uniref:Uncharacterized protein n=1 Tax=Hyalomma asiaticum TaxID=266040 RepID=A0ACB7S9V1_HYAAI|nr:hypothetical protein HPB50_014671 [Hyalomma asiaticum]